MIGGVDFTTERTSSVIRVVFVCLGNICRSPMAEAVFRHLVRQHQLEDQIVVDSAGTAHWHVGEPPHSGTLRELTVHGIETDNLVARQLVRRDLESADYLIAMDRENYAAIQRLGAIKGRLQLFMDLLPEEGIRDVPDPYYEGNFDEVYRLVETGARRLFDQIRQEHGL